MTERQNPMKSAGEWIATLASRRLARFVDRIERATGRTRAVLAFVAGALSVLSMAPFFVSPILFVTLPVLVWLIDSAGAVGHAATAARRASARSPSLSPSHDRGTLKHAALSGWLFGCGYFVFGMFWIGEAFLVEAEKFAWLLPFAVTLLPAGLALFFALAALLARLMWRPGFQRIMVLATTIGIAEGLRGHVLTGLPWNTLGYALTSPLALMQSAGLIGIYGLTIIAVIVFAAPLVVFHDATQGQDPTQGHNAPQGRGSAQDNGATQDALADDDPQVASVLAPFAGAALAVVLLAVLLGYGSYRLQNDPGARIAGVKLRIVQPSVPQRDKWRPEKQREIFDLHVNLTRHRPDGIRDDLKGITHVVWPEAAMPFLPLRSPQALKEIGDLLPDGTYLISGALRVEHDGDAGQSDQPQSEAASPMRLRNERRRGRHAFNSLMAFGPGGGLIAVYDKVHLVPFGEYLPLQGLLESIGLEQLTRIRGGFSVGRTPRPILDVPGLPPLVGLVCYEAIFPAAVVQGDDRPSLIINVTNDGWFGNTTGPRQHFHMARVRAVEEGLPLVRVANNGISAVIDGYGRTRARLNLDQRGVADSELPAAAVPTIYAGSGNFIYILYVLVSMLWFAGSNRRFERH